MKAMTSKKVTAPVAAAQAGEDDATALPRRPLRELMGDGLLDELLQRSLDVAQALMDLRRGPDAVDTLLEAHSVSDEWFRHQGLARSLVREMVERQRRLTPALRRLAGSMGVN